MKKLIILAVILAGCKKQAVQRLHPFLISDNEQALRSGGIINH